MLWMKGLLQGIYLCNEGYYGNRGLRRYYRGLIMRLTNDQICTSHASTEFGSLKITRPF